jgi:hypothetical protein
LSLPVHSDPALSEEVEALSRAIAGAGASAEIQDLARRVAEAQIDVRRVRCARHQFLSGKLGERFYESHADTRMKLALIGRCLQPNYAPDLSYDVLERFVTSTPQGPQKFALILSQEAKQLSAMDRYERRALSRRKLAIRALDEARRSDALDCVS